jgi:hypothetical protein
MKRMPDRMSSQMAWIRLLDDSDGGFSDGGRLMPTDAISVADARKLTTSIR